MKGKSLFLLSSFVLGLSFLAFAMHKDLSKSRTVAGYLDQQAPQSSYQRIVDFKTTGHVYIKKEKFQIKKATL